MIFLLHLQNGAMRKKKIEISDIEFIQDVNTKKALKKMGEILSQVTTGESTYMLSFTGAGGGGQGGSYIMRNGLMIDAEGNYNNIADGSCVSYTSSGWQVADAQLKRVCFGVMLTASSKRVVMLNGLCAVKVMGGSSLTPMEILYLGLNGMSISSVEIQNRDDLQIYQPIGIYIRQAGNGKALALINPSMYIIMSSLLH